MKKKHYSILELPLITEEGQKNAIDKKLECVRHVYNNMLSANLKKYNEMIRTREWRELRQIIKEELQVSPGKKTEKLKAAYERTNQILRENGFTEFDFISQSLKFAKYYQKHVPSVVAKRSVAAPMWSAFEKLLFGNGERVSFKKEDTVNTLTSDGKSGIRFLREEDGRYYVLCSNRNAKAKEIKLYVKGPKTTYDKEMLDANIKEVRIVKKVEKGVRKYYVQLTVERAPFIKLDKNGNPKHPVGTGSVGIAIWRNTLCAVSDDRIFQAKLSPNAEEFELRKAELNRELEHLRRVNNQQNFNEDGTVKKGIIGKDGKKQRLRWYESNHYKKVKEELHELHRKHSAEKSLLQNKLVLELLSMGDEFHFVDTSFVTRKPEWDEEDSLPNSEYKKKKERRRAIQESAPAALLTKLDKKLENFELEPVHRHTMLEELYWYQHEKGISDERFFPGESIVVNEEVVNQTMYRAFLIRHFDNEIKGLYDQEALTEEWDCFLAKSRLVI